MGKMLGALEGTQKRDSTSPSSPAQGVQECIPSPG
jgi:hypothetical protein